jgi:hypothetical protein
MGMGKRRVWCCAMRRNNIWMKVELWNLWVLRLRLERLVIVLVVNLRRIIGWSWVNRH